MYNYCDIATSYASEIGCLVARAFPGYPEDVLRELMLKALMGCQRGI